MTPKHLTCKEVVEQTSDFLDDTLAPEKKIELEQHLLTCPPCTIHLGQMRATLELAADLKRPLRPGEAPASVLDAFRAWKAQRK